MRALLDLMREDEAAVQALSGRCQGLLLQASECLRTLDPELGNGELIESVEVELAKLVG